MNDAPWTLRPASRTESGAVSQVIARAFVDLAIARHLVPDDVIRRVHCLAEQFEMVVDQAHVDGRVDVATVGSRIVGAVVWRFQVGTTPLQDPPGYAEKLRRICGPDELWRFLGFDDLLGKHHPKFAHDHAVYCATDADYQNLGIGTALLELHHRHIDSRPRDARRTAYLEASSPESARLYARLGYVAGDPVEIPNSDGATFLPMFRTPQNPDLPDRAEGTAHPLSAPQ